MCVWDDNTTCMYPLISKGHRHDLTYPSKLVYLSNVGGDDTIKGGVHTYATGFGSIHVHACLLP